MKKQYLALSLLTPVLCPALTAEARTPKENKVTNREQPNVIVILADDLGYGDLECYGAKNVQTPNVNRLAGEGIRFTNAHTVAATSTPSRYSLLTGEYAWRKAGTGIAAGDAAAIIRPERYTMANLFKDAGYNTGVVGKWHLGLGDKGGEQDWNKPLQPGTNDIGFEYSFIMAATGDRVPCVFVENDQVINLDPNDPIQVSYKANFPGEPTGKDNPELLKMHPSHGHDQSIVNGISRIGYMKGSSFALRRLSDRLCLENGLSIVENPKPRSKSKYRNYGEWQKDRKGPLSYQDRLRLAIDTALAERPADLDEFLNLMKRAGYEVKTVRGGGISFRLTGQGQERFTRLRASTLGDGYDLQEDRKSVV